MYVISAAEHHYNYNRLFFLARQCIIYHVIGKTLLENSIINPSLLQKARGLQSLDNLVGL